MIKKNLIFFITFLLINPGFTQEIDNQSVVFFEGFENEIFPPAEWAVYNLAGGSMTWERHTYYVHTGNASARHTFDAGMQVGWLITPPIKVPEQGDFIFEFWSYSNYPTYNYYSGIWISTTGGNPTTSTYTEIKQLIGSEISDSWKKISISLSNDYAGETVYVGFKYEGNNADGWHIDDVYAYNFTNYVEGELSSIISPNTGEELSANEEVKIMIKNNGSNPLTNFDMSIEVNGIPLATETYSKIIESLEQAEYTFNTKLDLSTISAYEIKITLVIPGDIIPENNTKIKRVANFHSETVQLVGYRIYEDNNLAPLGFISFNSSNPEKETLVSSYLPEHPATCIYAGEHIGNYFYAYTVEEDMFVNKAVDFVKISTETWTTVSSMPVTAFPLDMVYDYTTGIIYGIEEIEWSYMFTKFVTVDIETGAITVIDTLDIRALTLACSPNGELFAVDWNGYLFKIDKTTAATTAIGFTEIVPNYIQSMSFDQNTGRLFWAMFRNADGGKLIELDPVSGVGFNRGTIAKGAELVGLYSFINESSTYSVTLSADPEEGGRVTGDGQYLSEEMVTVKATPNFGFEFISWTKENSVVSTDSSFMFTITQDVFLTANFKKMDGISENVFSEEFYISPNPVTDLLKIVRPTSDKARIEVFNNLGVLIQSFEINGAEAEVNVAGLPKGIYLMRLVGIDIPQNMNTVRFFKN